VEIIGKIILRFSKLLKEMNHLQTLPFYFLHAFQIDRWVSVCRATLCETALKKCAPKFVFIIILNVMLIS
jgi:hypothetical protein